jgi:hypothetical protein
MKWHNAQRDELPEDGQLVLISVRGVYYIASFDTEGERFKLRDDPGTYFPYNEYLIYWTEFTDA